jgi:NAD(P)-dependent dehydrogenase (short-subunit alcohol dehydrogenase family)
MGTDSVSTGLLPKEHTVGRLDGKSAFITGSGSGIGRAAACLFSEQGAKVAVCDIDKAAGEQTVRMVREAGGTAVFVPADITQEYAVRDAVEAAVAAHGHLDILYNNAGGSTLNDGPVTEAPIEEFWRAISVDLFGTFLVSRFGIPHLINAGGGSVINTASNVALMALPGRDCYTAAKGGVASMTRSMAAEYAEHRIRVNAIAPSATRTDRVAAMAQADAVINSQVKDNHLLGWCEPEHIAYMALYLASDESAVTTGQVLAVDSGITIW